MCHICGIRTGMLCALCQNPICGEHSKPFGSDPDHNYEIISRICLNCHFSYWSSDSDTDDDSPETALDRRKPEVKTNPSQSEGTSTGPPSIYWLLAVASLGASLIPHNYFNFPTHSGNMSQMFSVKGRHVHGVIVDGGAATGLSGTDTILRYQEEVLWPAGLDISVAPSTATFTGVDGVSKPGLGRATVPLLLKGMSNVEWTTDLFGDTGSTCPSLLANDTLRKFRSTVYSNILPGGDGILVFVKDSDESFLFRLLLTDTGHYLLPTSGHNDKDPDKEQHQLRKAIRNYTNKILSNCVLGSKRRETSASLHSDTTGDVDARALITTSDDKPSKTGSGNEVTDITIVNEDQQTQQTVANNCRDGSHDVKPILKIGLERDNDAEMRLQIQPEDANLFARKSKFLDDWRKLPGPKYHEIGDRISDSLQSNRDYDSIVEKYKKIPEIFYTKTKLPVVTPDNFREWLSLVRQHSLEFQEVFSGSGNLSFHFLSHGASVAFPVDFRYGWNARLDKHRKMLDELIVGTSFYAPNCTAWSSLSNWMPEETRDDLRKLEGPVLEWITTRSVDMWEQHSSATNVENPRNSTIWTKSPLL